MKPDTWSMFLDPAIWGFFFEGVRETIRALTVGKLVSFPWG